ncbi:hypothetical protein T02_4951 [Trichinella nativa]|uniref:Uncharacterized protein n=1 Tax=Trichinella nativa TaxID=6335 RepID=A0A0V1LG90_9BILA|nr:hypothetical protein T02_4951 [Trichinella nativa]
MHLYKLTIFSKQRKRSIICMTSTSFVMLASTENNSKRETRKQRANLRLIQSTRENVASFKSLFVEFTSTGQPLLAIQQNYCVLHHRQLYIKITFISLFRTVYKLTVTNVIESRLSNSCGKLAPRLLLDSIQTSLSCILQGPKTGLTERSPF